MTVSKPDCGCREESPRRTNRAPVPCRSLVQSFPSPGHETEGLICGLQQSGNKTLLQAGCALLSSIPRGCTSPGGWGTSQGQQGKGCSSLLCPRICVLTATEL